MPYAHKTSQPTKDALRRGDLALAVNNSQNLGPTSATGYYNTLRPPTGGYAIYSLGLNNNPIGMAVTTDDEVIRAANTLGGSVSSKSDALSYLAGRTSTWILHNMPNNIVTDGLILNLDASLVSSYPTTGTDWYDISGANNNGEMKNGLSFNSGGWMDFDGADDYVWVPNDNGTMDDWNDQQTIIVWEYHDFTTGRRNIWNQAYGGFGTWTHESGGSINYYFGDSGANAQPYTSLNSSATVRGKWNMLCVTRDLTTINWYQNGVLTNTRSNPYGSLTNTTSGVSIGTGYTGVRWQGKMSKILAYTKALTQSEVLQNYYQAPIITDGLVFAVDAGNLVSYESGSTTTHSMTGSDTGTLTNGVGFDSANGGGWTFDGVDDYIDLGDLGLIQTDFAISLWYENGASKENFYFSTGYSNAGSILIFSDGIWINSSNTNGRLPGAPGRSIEGPTNIILTRTNGVAKWYKNGIYQSSLSYSGNITTGTNYTIGHALPRNKTTAYLEGKFYTLNIYNKGLTADEVSQNFNAQKSRFI